MCPTIPHMHNRVESECIDYSTQYPWSFGVLSVVMATGLHPLKDYPENFEGGNKVKYRSHDYQALPDSEQVSLSTTHTHTHTHTHSMTSNLTLCSIHPFFVNW